MFVIRLLIILKKSKLVQISIDRWMNNVYIEMKFYLATNENVIVEFLEK